MNGKELIKALNTIVEEKNISADIMIVMIILPAFCSVPPPRCPLFSILIQKLMLE